MFILINLSSFEVTCVSSRKPRSNLTKWARKRRRRWSRMPKLPVTSSTRWRRPPTSSLPRASASGTLSSTTSYRYGPLDVKWQQGMQVCLAALTCDLLRILNSSNKVLCLHLGWSKKRNVVLFQGDFDLKLRQFSVRLYLYIATDCWHSAFKYGSQKSWGARCHVQNLDENLLFSI